MSTSDRSDEDTADDGDLTPDEAAPPADASATEPEQTAPADDESVTAAEPVSAAEPADDTPAAEGPTDVPADDAPSAAPPTPSAQEPPSPDVDPLATAPGPRDTDSGRHATARPVPLPPEPAAAPVRASAFPAAAGLPPLPGPPAAPVESTLVQPAVPAYPTPTPAPAPAPAPTTPTPTTAVPPEPTYPAPITPEPPVDDGRLFPAPNAPRTPTAGTHVLGVIVGLLLGPIAVAGVLLGQARILAVQADHWDASLDVLGIVLVSCGLVLLACVLGLGAWTAAVPITAGAVLSLLGGFYLFAPGIARRQTLDVFTTEGWHTQVTQVTVVGTSGTLLVAGFLVLVAGIVVAYARRHGVHLGEFRARNRG